MLAQAFYEKRHLRRDGVEELGYEKIQPGSTVAIDHPDLSGVWYPESIGAALFTQERTRKGGSLDFQWKPNDRTELNLDGFYSKLNAANVNDNYMYWGNRELGRNLPTSFTVANNTLTSVTWPLTAPITAFTPPPPPPGMPCAGVVCTGGTAQDGIIVDGIVRPGSSA